MFYSSYLSPLLFRRTSKVDELWGQLEKKNEKSYFSGNGEKGLFRGNFFNNFLFFFGDNPIHESYSEKTELALKS